MSIPDYSDYKALVCIFLYGGNQSYNWIVPSSTDKYTEYLNSRKGLSIDQNSLHVLNGTASDGYAYGLHYNCPDLASLYNNGEGAVVCNVGTLIQPTTRNQVLNGTALLPPQIFSHVDQQTEWQTAVTDGLDKIGWAGRISDVYINNGVNFQLAMNVTPATTALLMDGTRSKQYVCGLNQYPQDIYSLEFNWRGGNGNGRTDLDTLLKSQALSSNNAFVKTYAQIRQNADDKINIIKNALQNTPNSPYTFPVTSNHGGYYVYLADQLRQIAKVIKASTTRITAAGDLYPTNNPNTIWYYAVDPATLGIAVGKTVTGQYIQSGTTVVSIGGNPSDGDCYVEISKPHTFTGIDAFGTPASFNFSYDPYITDKRQFFFAVQYEFDTHDNELSVQQRILGDLNDSIKVFRDEMVTLGIWDKVTVFTNSEFSRSLAPNGDGSDHAWGGHSMVFGGSVNAGYYGIMPSLVCGGVDDYSIGGRIIPTTSVEQYSATLAKWFGINDADMYSLFPNLHKFTPKYLGFMK